MDLMTITNVEAFFFLNSEFKSIDTHK